MTTLRQALTAYYSTGLVRDPVVRRHGAYSLVLEYVDCVPDETAAFIRMLEAEHCGEPSAVPIPV